MSDATQSPDPKPQAHEAELTADPGSAPGGAADKAAHDAQASTSSKLERTDASPTDAATPLSPAIAPEAYSALAACALSFAWLGVLTGVAFLAAVAADSASRPEDAPALFVAMHARIALLTRIEIGLSLVTAVLQLYARVTRGAWIAFGCVLIALLIDVGWLQPELSAVVTRVHDGTGEPVAPDMHMIVSGLRAAALLALALLNFTNVAQRSGR